MKNKLYKIDCVLIFLLIFIPRLIISIKAYPFVYVSDETSAIAIAATVAGYNWNDVVSQAGYYGIGYLWIYAPLFHMFDNPVLIYRMMLIGLSVTVSITGIICYYVMSSFFCIQDRMIKITISSISGLISVFVSLHLNVRNEEILYLIIWLVIVVLCSIIKNTKEEKSNIINNLIIVVLLLYSLTVHTRAICLIIGVFAMDILLRSCKKKCILHKFSYLSTVIGYIAVKFCIKLYQGTIWTNNVRNSSVTSSLNSSLTKIQLFDIETYLDMLRIALGQIYTACIMTGGLFLVCIIVMLLFFYYYFKDIENYEFKEYIFVIGGIFLFCTVFTIAGQSVTWLPGVYKGTTQDDPSVFVTHYRAFQYMRYMGAYVAPFIMCACILIYQNKSYLKRTLKISILLFVGLTLFWIKFIHPLYKNNKAVTYLLMGSMKAENDVTASNYFHAYLLVLSMLSIFLVVSRVKHGFKAYMFMLICLMIANRVYIFNESTYNSEIKYYGKADAGYELIVNLRNRVEIDDIYVYDATDANDHNIYYTYQFLNFDKHIIPNLPEQEVDEDILLFSNKKINNNLDESYQWCKLDNNEYVYTKGDSIVEVLKACGVEVQTME